MVYDAIIRCDWYLLLPKERLLYTNLMHNAQNAKALTVGGVSPLNMVTCVAVSYIFAGNFIPMIWILFFLAQLSQILKVIYSFLMAMFTFMA